MSARVYCTCFDRNYFSRGLALFHSLKRHDPDARLWVLCLDDVAHQLLGRLALPDLVPVPLATLEAADPELAATRSSRSRVEYYFTCTPAWLLYVTGAEASADWVTYLDSDLYFFGSPDRIFGEMEGASFAIIPHRYAPAVEHMRRYGTYNVGWVGVRQDGTGLAALTWWREKCIEWCYDKVDGDRFADQGYLDGIVRTFPGVVVIENPGANLAPWNIGNYRLAWRDNAVLIDSRHPLVFFHFQGLKREMGVFLFNSHRLYRAPFSAVVRQHIYRPYIDELLALDEAIGPLLGIEAANPLRRVKVDTYLTSFRGVARNIGKRLLRMLDIVTGRAFLVLRGKAYRTLPDLRSRQATAGRSRSGNGGR